MVVNGKDLSDLVQDKCVLACRDFLKEELPDLALEHPSRYLSFLIEDELRVRAAGDGLQVVDDKSPFQCVSLRSADGEPAFVVMGRNMSRERTEQALDLLRSSKARDRLLLYLFSFESLADEELISQAIMEAELMRMVRDTGIVAYFAMLDARAGMGMLARIDGDLRSIQYLPH